MGNTILKFNATLALVSFISSAAFGETKISVGDDIIKNQRAALAVEAGGQGYGPQSPRDIDLQTGSNNRTFSTAPEFGKMSLCDIHFHKNAEHKGGNFTSYAGNGDGKGYGTGFKYDGSLTDAESAPIGRLIGVNGQDSLKSGDTIEIHFVYSTAKATIGPTLGTCLSEAIGNPQLRVEAVVAVLVNDGGESLTDMARVEILDDLNQAPNLPNDLGAPVVYAGSTTGPAYNEKGSPFQVTWSVRPKTTKLNISSVEAWLEDNPFGESFAHGVRNLVLSSDLLSEIN